MIGYRSSCLGEVAEWSIALDLKSSNQQWFVGSNPTLSVLTQSHLDSACPIVLREGKIKYTRLKRYIEAVAPRHGFLEKIV